MKIEKFKVMLGLGPDDPNGKPEGQAAPQAPAPAKVPCAWCDKACDTEKDGFHVVHVAFGTTQERHTFCSDECYEAFRKMYPARVHRDCYERKCADCDFCIKRYDEETDSLLLLTRADSGGRKQV